MHNQAKEVPLAGIIILCKRPGDSDHKVFPCRSHFSLIFECVEIIIPAGRITGHCHIQITPSKVNLMVVVTYRHKNTCVVIH